MIRRLVLPALLTALLSVGCSLPLPGGVHSAGGVPAEQRPQDDITVIPPGPRPGQAPVDVVSGFLNAQSSAQGNHSVARRFLANRSAWDDTGDVLVYDPASLHVTSIRQQARSAEVQTTVVVTAAVRRDGVFVQLGQRTVTDSYRLEREPGPQQKWRLTSAAPGLRLTAADRDRSFSAVRTYFLAPTLPGTTPHLVADALFLPAAPTLARSAAALVRRLVAGPSSALAGSVQSALPPGSRVERVSADGTGLVEVALSGDPRVLRGPQRQALSAQLVFTLHSLPGFTALRLRVGGPVLAVPATGTADQNVGTWDSYDPAGLAPHAPLFYVDERRLRALNLVLPPGPATAGNADDRTAVPVGTVAVTPDLSQVALLAGRTLRTGSLRGASYPVVLSRPGLSSPTWGAGGSGLWLLQGTTGVLRLAGGTVQDVPLAGLTGGLTSLALARDGVRVAVAAGGRLLVGRIEWSAGRPRVVGLTDIAPALQNVTRVAWAGATSLVAVGSLLGTVLPVQLAVDGASLVPLDGPGLPGPPLAVTASPDGTVVAAAGPTGSRLYRATGSGFSPLPGNGAAPAFPG